MLVICDKLLGKIVVAFDFGKPTYLAVRHWQPALVIILPLGATSKNCLLVDASSTIQI